MIYELHNDQLSVKVKDNGAEMCSLLSVKSQREYLWTADKSYWGRHAPVLFPIVGQVQDGKYHIGDREFQLSQHGFARDRKFEVIHASDQEIVLSLQFDEETLQKYPYQFELKIAYKLVANQVSVHYEVINLDTDSIWFSIGAHPGFLCPFKEDTAFGDYYLEFDQNETLERLDFEDGLLSGTTSVFLENENRIQLSHDLFDQDAIIFERMQSNYVDFKCQNEKEYMRFDFSDFPFFAIWSPPGKEAPFVCLEPWFGITDTRNSGVDYREKKGIQQLKAGEKFSSVYAMSICE